jgi:hypothetical protein
MEKPNKRLRMILDFVGAKSAESFAASIGVGGQGIRDILRAKLTEKGVELNITKRLADKITAKYPEINQAWLLTGVGTMLEDQEPANNQTNMSITLHDRIKELEKVIADKDYTITIQKRLIAEVDEKRNDIQLRLSEFERNKTAHAGR